MSEEVITPNTVPDGEDVTPAEGKSADDSISLQELATHLGKDFKDVDSALKSIKDTFSYIGRQDEIRNAVKEMVKRTGTDERAVLSTIEKIMSQGNQNDEVVTPTEVAPQPATPEAKPNTDGFVSRAQYEEDMFFNKKPEYETIKGILKPIKNSSDEYKAMSWSDFVQTEQVKELHETYNGYNELKGSRSVLETNPRLGAITDKMTKAKQNIKSANDAMRAGDIVSARESSRNAEQDAVRAVIESFNS